ncbi:MAG: DUF4136 domain-containing protein [Spirosomaceae bacterium]|nr:DUF4136 domain-containing protein [Spirosomataceae bacterium]MDP5140047.1 DUF4136 domain-containing protein [Spirosomataceae bacterium]
MRNIASLLLLSLLFSACHRPVMRASLEEAQPQERDLLTYSVLNKIETINDECISAAIEQKMTESGFFKTPFEADLKIYYRYAFSDEVSKKDKKIQVLVIDNKSNACIWKGETVYLPKNLKNKEILMYTHLLMQRFEWENKNNDLFVRN